MSPLDRAYLRILLLTGQRRTEIAHAKVEHLTRAGWLFPETKNGKAHSIPITDLMLAELRLLPSVDSGYLFSTTAGKRPIGAFNDVKARLDKAMTKAAASAVEPFTLHALRHTMKTHWTKLGISKAVSERQLNHTSGEFAGMAGLYNHHDFMAERKAATELWGVHLVALAEGKKAPQKPVSADDGKLLIWT